jgi:hypothetical protein
VDALEAQRTIVKSVPELWAELSEVALLGRMLHDQFGEIRITRLTPESNIEWKSEQAAGQVELAPAGFGTRVRLTAQLAAPPPEAETIGPVAPTLRTVLLTRLFGRRRKLIAQPTRDRVPAPTPAPALDHALAQGALAAVLDEIGAARHRPFSRDPGAAASIT